MKKSIWMSCAIALAIPALADDNAQSSQHQPSSSSQSSTSQADMQPWQKAQSQEFFRASKIIGKQAQSQDGKKIGEISDVVFNQRGELFVLVGTSKSKMSAVPWQVFNAHTAKGDQAVVIKSTLQAIASAPSVTDEQWGSLNNPQFTKGIYSYYKIQPASAGAASSPEGQTSGSSSQDESVDKSSSESAAPSSSASAWDPSSTSITNSTSSATGGSSDTAEESKSGSDSDSSSDKSSEDKAESDKSETP